MTTASAIPLGSPQPPCALPYGYGSTPDAEPQSDYVKMAVQAITGQYQDPHRAVAAWESRLRTAQALRLSPIVISEIKAQLEGAKRRAAMREESEMSQREFADLGKLAIYGGVALGAAATFYILVQALSASRRRR